MVDLLWLGEWAIVGFLVGFLLYIIMGFLARAVLGIVTPISKLLPTDWVVNKYKYINGFANHYSKIAMKIIGRAVVVERGTKYDLYKTSHDPEKNADKFNFDGETAHVTNDTGFLSTMYQRPFGLIGPPEEDMATYLAPELGELGKVETNRKEKGDLRDDDGEYNAEVTLSDRRPLVQLREYARRMIPGQRSLYDLDETIDLYEQSQRLFGESKTTQFMILIIAYSAAAIVMWVVLTQAGGSADPEAIEIPATVVGGWF